VKRTPLSPALVIASAASLADEAGFETVSLSEVARRLGVQTPSLYSHVRDLAALRDGITALAFADLAARISPQIAGRSGREALHGLATAYRQFATESPGRWQSLQRRAGTTVVESGAAVALVALNDAVLRDYALSPEYRVHATRLIGSTINGFLALERVGNFDHSVPEPAESWTVAIDGLDILLRTWSTQTRSTRTEAS
jgi:AcrR family transcriptional regulator